MGHPQEKHGFSSWHTSEFLALNNNCEAANWDAPKLERVFLRVRQIAKKYGVKVISFAVAKQEYDEAIPPDLRRFAGKFHYTWAVRNLLDRILGWRRRLKIPALEYVFDWVDPRADRKKRREIEAAIEQAEEAARQAGFPGEFENVTFRHRENIPGLQCSDALAWTAFHQAQWVIHRTPLSDYAETAWADFDATHDPKWREMLAIRKSELQRWANHPGAVAHASEFFRKWAEKKVAQKPPSKKKNKKRPDSRRTHG
jgi:Protein of unknown function (DUF3800)